VRALRVGRYIHSNVSCKYPPVGTPTSPSVARHCSGLAERAVKLPFFQILLTISLMLAGAHAQTTADREIVFGMSTVLSGPAANLGNDMRVGVMAGFERANRAGGVKGLRLRLLALDDGYEPARTAPNMRRLLEHENVLGVIGNVGTPTAIAALPIVRERRTLFFAPFTGAGALRQDPPDRYVINYRASYAEETGAMIDALVGSGAVEAEEIAFFTQRDGYGDAGFGGAVAALKRHGLQDSSRIQHVRYERNTLAVEHALATLLYAEREPRVVIMVGAYAPCAKFIKLAEQAGLKSAFLNVSFVGSEALAENLGNSSARVIVTQVVPYPMDGEMAMAREYQADLAVFDPGAAPRFGSFEGYIAARILIRALETVQGSPTREGVVAALEALGDFDLGLGEPLRLDTRRHQACHRVWPTVFADGRFVPFAWKDIGQALPKESRP
jgi:branched-chain amino acid transport system substrate-binding protein